MIMHRIFGEDLCLLARTVLILGASMALVSCSSISVTVRPQDQTVEAGGSAVYDINITRIRHQGPVSLGLSPASSSHYSTTLQPNPVTGDQSQLTVQVAPDALIGAYEIDVTSTPPTRPPLYGVPPNRANLVVGPCGARWIRQFSTIESDSAFSVKLNANGDIFVYAYLGPDSLVMKFNSTGELEEWDRIERASGGALDLDPQGKPVVAARVVQNNMRQYLIRRYTVPFRRFGILDLNVTFGNDPYIDPVSGLETDGSGNIYVIGNTRGDLGGVNPDRSHTNIDGWIAKYDSAGNQQWLRQTLTFEHDSYNSVAVDNAGAVYVRGTRGLNTVLLRKIDAETGDVVWTEEVPVSLAYVEGALAVDASGNVYVAFHRASPTAFTDPVLMKYTPNQVQLWSASLESRGISVPLGMAIDAAGEPIVVGRRMTGSNQVNGSMARFDANGAPAWNPTIDATFQSSAEAIDLDPAGEMYIVGDTDGNFAGQNGGRTDAWLGKLKQGGCVF
jgi:outer membrane protein assembly factor BamB